MRPEIKNYKAEADADLIPIPGQSELHGRCRCCVLLSAFFCALFVADLIAGMEELELHCRRRGRYNFRKIKIATISVRMVVPGKSPPFVGILGSLTSRKTVWRSETQCCVACDAIRNTKRESWKVSCKGAWKVVYSQGNFPMKYLGALGTRVSCRI